MALLPVTYDGWQFTQVLAGKGLRASGEKGGDHLMSSLCMALNGWTTMQEHRNEPAWKCQTKFSSEPVDADCAEQRCL